MHKFLKFIFGIKLYMFRTVPLSETCRVLFQNKFDKSVHLVGFIIGKSSVQLDKTENNIALRIQ